MSESQTATPEAANNFFEGLSPEQLKTLNTLGREVKLDARTTIFEEYDRAKDVYVILSGQVSVLICESNQCRQISVIGEGDMLGWSPLLHRTRLFDTAVTLTPVKALVFDSKKLLEFCDANPDFGYMFMKKAAAALATRLSGTRLQLMQMCGNRFPVFDMNVDTD